MNGFPAWFEDVAFTLNEQSGTYAVDFDRMQDAIRSLSARLLQLQGNGDYDVAKAFIDGGIDLIAPVEIEIVQVAARTFDRSRMLSSVEQLCR